MAFEQGLGVARQIKKGDTFVNIRRPGLLMVRNLTQTAVLRGAPFR
ncbi:MAG: hypothetical protein OXD33_13865 [Rhodobacteraceae bacterium]|nr:hypothetical protein [Paracoccaceae bacterium]